jgi:hypothetical protein
LDSGSLHFLYVDFSMSIALFVTVVNIGFALSLLWVARQVWQWRRSLSRLNRSLQAVTQTVQQTVQQQLVDGGSPITPMLFTEYQQFAEQLFPRFQFSVKTFAQLRRVYRLWRVTMKKRRGF